MSQRLLFEEGGVSLHGSYELSPDVGVGALLVLTALLSSEEVVINNIPASPTVDQFIELIQFLGGSIERKGENKLIVRPEELSTLAVPAVMLPDPDWRFLTLCVLATRYGEAAVELRSETKLSLETELNSAMAKLSLETELSPVADFTGLGGWDNSGLEFQSQNGMLIARVVKQPTPTGTTTCQLMRPDLFLTLGAVAVATLRTGNVTTLVNVSTDPMVESWVDVLVEMGAEIKRLSDGKLEITGVAQLAGGQITVSPSLDEAVVVATAAAITRGDIEIKGVRQEGMVAFLSKLQQAGVSYQLENSTLRVWADRQDQLKPVNVTTGWYPGFQSSWVGPLAVLLSQAQGESEIIETVDGNSLVCGNFLKQAGAEVLALEHTNGRGVKIFGPTPLKGQTLTFVNGHTCAVPMLIGLAAKGTTELTKYEQFLARYPYMLDKLTKLGAKIKYLEIDGDD